MTNIHKRKYTSCWQEYGAAGTNTPGGREKRCNRSGRYVMCSDDVEDMHALRPSNSTRNHMPNRNSCTWFNNLDGSIMCHSTQLQTTWWSPTKEQIKKPWYIYAIRYYSAIEMNGTQSNNMKKNHKYNFDTKMPDTKRLLPYHPTDKFKTWEH